MTKFITVINGIPRLRDESASAVTIYDESVSITGTVSTGTPVTLPSSKTYDSDELEVYLNGQRLDAVLDYNYVGGIPRSQVTFTFDLEDDDEVRFRIDRTA